MIPDWRGALAAGRGALSPQGRLQIVDFGDFAHLPGPARQLLGAWLGHFQVTPRNELLAELESGKGQKGWLNILAGRYAFQFSSTEQGN